MDTCKCGGHMLDYVTIPGEPAQEDFLDPSRRLSHTGRSMIAVAVELQLHGHSLDHGGQQQQTAVFW